MKFPQNIILDVSKKQLNSSSQYWIYKYMNSMEASNFEVMRVSDYKLFLAKRENFLPKKFAQNQKKFTIKYSLNSKAYFLKKDEKKSV